MNLKNKAMLGVVLALAVLALGLFAGAAKSSVAVNSEPTEQLEVATTTDYATTGTAGVVSSLDELEEKALDGVQEVSVAKLQVAVVTASQDEITAIAETPAMSEEELRWMNLVMADVKDKMNVRAEASADSELVGRMRKGDVAEVIEIGEEWTHIRSGNVDGYIKNDYCIYGLEAMDYAYANVDIRATVTGSGVRVRDAASTEGGIVAAVSKGATLIVDPDTEAPEGWVAVGFTGKTRYVSADYVDIKLCTTEAITIEEEQEIARKKAEEEAKRRAAQVTDITIVYHDAYPATTDEILLMAAVIQCEAGGESFEGQVAVGAVILNRVRSSRYPNTIAEVVYAPGQFTPVGNGKVDRVLANGPKETCIKAAQEAINGVDYTAGAKSFRTKHGGHAGLVIGNHVFFNCN